VARLRVTAPLPASGESSGGLPPTASSPNGTGTGDLRYALSSASLAANITSAALGASFQPRDAAGNALRGQLNLYTGEAARMLAEEARASGNGYLIGDTVYKGPAELAEQALRARLGIPTGDLPQAEYEAIWGTASKLAVRDAAISGSVTTHNDLATLNPHSIQAKFERPTYRNYGGGMGGLNLLAGGLTIWGASQDETEWRAALGYTGGGLQVAGGGTMIVGALRTSPLLSVGRFAGTAGAVVTAPILLSQAYDDLSSQNEYRQVKGVLKGLGVVAPPASFLATYLEVFVEPAGLVLYETTRGAISEAYGVPMSWVY